jgi:cell division transport system permease protein
MRLGLVLGEAASGLRRNISMVISIVLVTFISLTFVGAAMLLQMQISQMKDFWYDRSQVTVYLCLPTDRGDNCSGEEATQAEKDTIAAALDSDTLGPYVQDVAFEDHQMAYENFVAQFGDLGDYITPESVSESYRVNLVDPNEADVIIEALSNTPGVQSVVDQRSYLQPIFTALNVASYTAVGLAALMLIAAVLLIATTIRLSAFSRRRELGIMRLVGASNRFIQTPFILEGVFAAVIGSVLASAAVVAIVHFFVGGYLEKSVSIGNSISFVGLDDALLVVPVLIVIGIVLAAASAGFAINRYLKV